LPFKIKFGKEPKQNTTVLVQDKSINGYKILSHDKKTELYHITGKTATTRGKYRFRRVADDDNVGLGSVIRGQIDNEYKLVGTIDEDIATVKIGTDGITVHVSDDEYHCVPDNRAQSFQFYNKDKKLVLTIDKKILSRNDVYNIRGVENFPYLIAQMLGVVIDDFYHESFRI
jgi:hypothetical protein